MGPKPGSAWRLAEKKASRIIAQELAKLGWKEADLGPRRQSDVGKVKIAQRLRREPTVGKLWIAQPLAMASVSNVTFCLGTDGSQRRLSIVRPFCNQAERRRSTAASPPRQPRPSPKEISLEADLPPAQYALLAQRRVQKRFGFDIVVVKDGSENLEQAVAFFQQVRERPGMKKGLLRIAL